MLGLVVGQVGPVPAPIIPEAAFGIAALASLLAFLVCFGMAQVWKQTIGAGLHWIADKIDGASVHVPHVGHFRPFGPVAAAFRAVSDNVYHAFGWAALKAQHSWNYCANRTAAIFTAMVEEIEALSRTLLRATTRTVTVTLPRWQRQAIRRAAHANAEAIGALRRAERRALGTIRHAVARVEAHAAHATHAADHALDWSRSRVGRLDKRLDRQADRLDALRKHFGAVAFAGLVAAALTRLGLKWLRCSNTKKAAKHVCGMDANLLDSLIADATLIVGAVSLVELCRELQDVTELAERGIQGLIREA